MTPELLHILEFLIPAWIFCGFVGHGLLAAWVWETTYSTDRKHYKPSIWIYLVTFGLGPVTLVLGALVNDGAGFRYRWK